MSEAKTLPSGQTRIDKLEMRGITKRFPGVLANDHVDFDVRSGEVHALLGENGAGKSTLMKILYGLYHPDEGQILLNGKPVTIDSPTDSIDLGIGMIHQHFMLVQTLTVAENVALGLPSSRGLITDLDRVTKRILELADIYGLKIDPSAYIWQLSVGQQQRVEIIKALYRGAALLILDEPTAVLTPQEVDELFVIMRQMVRDGHALIFISHKLHEVVSISNRISVLRDGRLIGTRSTSDTTKQSLANWMVGREIGFAPDRGEVQRGEVRLKRQKHPAGDKHKDQGHHKVRRGQTDKAQQGKDIVAGRVLVRSRVDADRDRYRVRDEQRSQRQPYRVADTLADQVAHRPVVVEGKAKVPAWHAAYPHPILGI